MPKGIPRKANPDLYVAAGSKEPSNAPQAAPHRRGGTHRVKDEDRTNTVYDTFNYAELVAATKERRLHYKDIKKAAMIRALANDDKQQRIAAKVAAEEYEHRIKMEKRAAEKRKDELEQQRQKNGQGSVNGVTKESTSAQKTRELYDEALTEYSWSSSSSDSSVFSMTHGILPARQLRLFEWTRDYQSPSETAAEDVLLPWQTHYTPLKVVTTRSKDTIDLPDHAPFVTEKHPVRPLLGPSPDYVPALSLQERFAARNGVLQGPLGPAKIIRASVVATYTLVQGWNARMYFELPPRTEGADLADVYRKWKLEKRKLLRVQGRDNGAAEDRMWRHTQIRRNQGRRAAEMYQASHYRPLAMCYLPAYLDFDNRSAEDGHVEDHRSLENLFYIQFPGCDLPHYYFWAQEDVWADPTKPNPAWQPGMVPHQEEIDLTDDEMDTPITRTWRWIRFKNPNVVVPDAVPPSSATDFSSKLTNIERQLYTQGLAPTLYEFRKKWLANGRQYTWRIFARNLRELYPNGELPDAPPLDIEDDEATLAFKLATIDDLKDVDYKLFDPLTGDEAWTRHDEEYWGIIDLGTDEPPADKTELQYVDVEMEDVDTASEVLALHRRSSMPAVESWLDQLSSSHVLPAPDYWTSVTNQKWEEEFLRPAEYRTNQFCPVCCKNWVAMTPQAQQQHVLSHGTIRHIQRRQKTITRPSPLAIPPAIPKPSYSIFYDDGTDGDLDTPIKTFSSRRYRIKSKSRARSHVLSPSLQFLGNMPFNPIRKASRQHNHRLRGGPHVQGRSALRAELHLKRKRENKENYNEMDSLSFLNACGEGKKKRRKRV